MINLYSLITLASLRDIVSAYSNAKTSAFLTIDPEWFVSVDPETMAEVKEIYNQAPGNYSLFKLFCEIKKYAESPKSYAITNDSFMPSTSPKGQYMSTPCNNCPFRKDTLKGWLGRNRMKEICESESFVCHKETKRQCAGYMLVNPKRSLFVRMAKALKINLALRGKKDVFDSPDDCINHHQK